MLNSRHTLQCQRVSGHVTMSLCMHPAAQQQQDGKDQVMPAKPFAFVEVAYWLQPCISDGLCTQQHCAKHVLMSADVHVSHACREASFASQQLPVDEAAGLCFSSDELLLAIWTATKVQVHAVQQLLEGKAEPLHSWALSADREVVQVIHAEKTCRRLCVIMGCFLHQMMLSNLAGLLVAQCLWSHGSQPCTSFYISMTY